MKYLALVLAAVLALYAPEQTKAGDLNEAFDRIESLETRMGAAEFTLSNIAETLQTIKKQTAPAATSAPAPTVAYSVQGALPACSQAVQYSCAQAAMPACSQASMAACSRAACGRSSAACARSGTLRSMFASCSR